MKTIHRSWSDLANDLIQILIIGGAIGVAAKLISYFNKWVYFPSFPNVVDATFIVTAVIYLSWKSRQHPTTPNNPLTNTTTLTTANET